MNNELTDNEVNEVIAEYLGVENLIYSNIAKKLLGHLDGYEWASLPFTESLDALVPVWEKLRGKKTGYKNICIDADYLNLDDSGNFWQVNMNCACDISLTFKTIQQAAAHATAKAILELNEVNNAKL